MNLYINLAIRTVFLITLSGCLRESEDSQLRERINVTGGGKITINITTASALVTKSGVFDDNINNLHILIYNSANELVLSQSHLPSPSLTAILPKGGYTVALLANYSVTDISKFNTLEKLFDSEAGSEVMSDGKMVYSGFAVTQLNSAGVELNITLKRVIAKVTFVFDKSGLNPDTDVDITRIELINVPSAVKLFAENRPGVSGIVTSGDMITENTEPSSHEEASPLYMFENLQGVSDNNQGASGKIPGVNRESCTYVQIWADYVSPQKSGKVKYRLYLGENSVNDFNIFRETHYRENIRFTGNAISEISWRVDISGLTDVEYLITLSATPPEGGTVGGGGYYKYGAIPSLTASPSAGFRFSGWTPDIVPVTSNKNYSAIFTQEVPVVGVTGISLNISSIKLDTGESYTARAVISPENATNKKVIWSSSDENIAEVNSSTGEVKAKSNGSCVIYAMSEDGGFTSSYIAEVFYPLRIEVKTHEILEYDQITGKITNCVLILYSRVILDIPSDMAIVNAISPWIAVNVNYSYKDKGIVKYGSTTLRLNTINNNDYPWNGVAGISEIFTFTSPATHEEIVETIESFTFSVIPSERYAGSYHVKW